MLSMGFRLTHFLRNVAWLIAGNELGIEIHSWLNSSLLYARDPLWMMSHVFSHNIHVWHAASLCQLLS
jgi:hypothetical protein